MKMDPRCPSTPATPCGKASVSFFLVAASLGLSMIYLECSPPRVSLVDSLFIGGSEELDGVSSEWRLAPVIRFPRT
jgi:hypothetical protein